MGAELTQKNMHDNFQCGRGSYTHITAGATTQVFSGAGRLHNVIINKALTGTVAIIDGVTGSTANVATLTNGTTAPLGTIQFNLLVGKGLRVINSAAEDITLVWSQ